MLLMTLHCIAKRSLTCLNCLPCSPVCLWCATGGRERQLPLPGKLPDCAECEGYRGHARAAASGAQPDDQGVLVLHKGPCSATGCFSPTACSRSFHIVSRSSPSQPGNACWTRSRLLACLCRCVPDVSVLKLCLWFCLLIFLLLGNYCR